MKAIPCAHCGIPMVPRARKIKTPLPPGHRRHAGRGLCNSCYRSHEIRDLYDTIFRPRDERVEEAQFLLDAGYSPRQVVDRLGITAGAVARAAYRSGADALANEFEREKRRSQRVS